MSTAAFDTLTAVQNLEASGFERRQAEAIATAINHGDERAATKADLDVLESRMRADLYRALWIQGVGIVAVIGGFIAIAASLKLLCFDPRHTLIEGTLDDLTGGRQGKGEGDGPTATSPTVSHGPERHVVDASWTHARPSPRIIYRAIEAMARITIEVSGMRDVERRLERLADVLDVVENYFRRAASR